MKSRTYQDKSEPCVLFAVKKSHTFKTHLLWSKIKYIAMTIHTVWAASSIMKSSHQNLSLGKKSTRVLKDIWTELYSIEEDYTTTPRRIYFYNLNCQKRQFLWEFTKKQAGHNGGQRRSCLGNRHARLLRHLLVVLLSKVVEWRKRGKIIH